MRYDHIWIDGQLHLIPVPEEGDPPTPPWAAGLVVVLAVATVAACWWLGGP